MKRLKNIDIDIDWFWVFVPRPGIIVSNCIN